MFDLSSFIEASQSPAIATDSNGKILSLNKYSENILGLDSDELVGKNITAFLPAVKDLIISKPANQNFYRIMQEYSGCSKQLKQIEILSNCLILDKQIYYCFMLYERSDMIKNQLEVEKIKERYQLAVEAGHTGVWDYYIKNNQLIIDDSLKNLLGYTVSQEIDEAFFWEKLVAEEDRIKFREAIDKNISEGKTYFEETFRMIHRHRVLLWVLCRGKIFYYKGKPHRIICSVTDITDRKEASEKLRKTLINFKAVFDAFPDLFFRVDRIGDFLEIMAGESSDFGLTDITSYEGKNIIEAFPESEYYKLYNCLKLTFENRKVEKCEYNLKLNGIKRYYEARMIAISDDEAIGIVRDITEAVKVNKELIKAKQTSEEALNAKDEFLSMMSHEIRTPLNVVIGMIYLLLKQDPRADQLKFINSLKFSADNLLSLINDLLDFSKIKAGKIVFENTDFNLRDFIHNIYESYKLQLDSSRVEVILAIDDKLPIMVNGDSNRLAQILNNLLSNAQKFTERGQLCIDVKLKDMKDTIAYIDFSISDSGIGISKDKLKTIFEPFEQGETNIQRKYGGTGLGLTIVKQLVDLLGGEIQVDSNPGKGSTFIVNLPLAFTNGNDEKQQTITEKLPLQENFEKLRILYADDVNSNQFLMKGYADLWKYDIDTTSNGKDTLRYFQDNRYDVILIDLQMPVMDGFETSEKIREIEKETGDYTPIIAVTGDISDETVAKIFETGMDDYLSKPVNPKIMLDKIHGLLRKGTSNNTVLNTVTFKGTSNSNDIRLLEFDDVDYLYTGVSEQYIHYISMLIKEFKTNLQLIGASLSEENYDEFRRIKHSMNSNMKLLRIQKLQDLLNEIDLDFSNNQFPPLGGSYIRQVEELITMVLEQLEDKLNVLTT